MSLPLKVKVAVRDSWDKPDSPVQKSIAELKGSLGLEIRCEPDWSLLLAELGSVYEDKAQLVTTNISIIKTWFETVSELVDDEKQEEWSEKLVDKLRESFSRLTLNLEVSDKDRASTEWSDTRKGFFLYLPNVQIHQAAQFASTFKDQLLDCFEEKKHTSQSQSLPIHSTTGDEWADVSVEVAAEKSAPPAARTQSAVPSVDFLPDPKALPKPGTLLLKPPYHLFVYYSGNNKVEIQCSHTPTLDVLHEYLKKWVKTNPNLTNKPPALGIQLNHVTCAFGLYDTLTVAAENRHGNWGGMFTVSPTLILSLVEGVLGYERVYSDATSWQFRKDTPYRNA